MVKDYVCGRCVFALKTNKLIINNWYMGFHLTQVTTKKPNIISWKHLETTQHNGS